MSSVHKQRGPKVGTFGPLDMYNIIRKAPFVKTYKPFINSILIAFLSCLNPEEALTYGDLVREQQEAVILIRKGGALGRGSAS